MFAILWYRHHFLQSAILYRVTSLMSSFFEHSVDEVEDVVIKPLVSVTFILALPCTSALYSSRELYKYFQNLTISLSQITAFK